MKKISLILLSVLFSTLIFSQKFEYTYNTVDEINLYNAIELNDGYLFAGTRGVYPNLLPLYLKISKIGAFQFDSTDFTRGNVMGVTLIKNDSINLYQIISESGGGLEVSLIDKYWNNRVRYTYSDSLKYIVYNAKIDNDSTFLMAGYSTNNLRNNDAFFYYLDLSNYKDTMINIGNSIPYNFASDVIAINNKYYVFKLKGNSTPFNCSAMAELMVFNQDFSVDTVLAICNSASSNINGTDLYFVLSALKIDSSTFMMSGRSQGNNVSNMNQKREDISVVKWDTNFTELNATIFGKRDSFAVEATSGISRFENDSFVYVGGTENYKVNPSGYDTTTSYYLLSKVDLNGNVLWTRYYTNNTYLQLFKVLATSDGGALMVGTSYDHQNASGLEKDVWIVKVDSNGDYRTSTSVPEMSEIPSSDYVFYPNPVKEQLTFRQVNHLREVQIELYDLNGKKVLDHFSNQSEQNIDVSGLAKGTYVYRLVDSKGNYASGKIVKQ